MGYDFYPGDGVAASTAFPMTPRVADNDGDGWGDNADADDDNDGISDSQDDDMDGDGFTNDDEDTNCVGDVATPPALAPPRTTWTETGHATTWTPTPTGTAPTARRTPTRGRLRDRTRTATAYRTWLVALNPHRGRR